MKTLHFSITIHAPRQKVYKMMLEPKPYKEWTQAFEPTSYYEGDWSKGSKIKFLSQSGGGMYAEIAENRKNEFVSVRHLGYIQDGKIDTESPQVKAWAPAYENYTFAEKNGQTELKVEQDIIEEYEEMFQKLWPKALKKLKEICEK